RAPFARAPAALADRAAADPPAPMAVAVGIARGADREAPALGRSGCRARATAGRRRRGAWRSSAAAAWVRCGRATDRLRWSPRPSSSRASPRARWIRRYRAEAATNRGFLTALRRLFAPRAETYGRLTENRARRLPKKSRRKPFQIAEWWSFVSDSEGSRSRSGGHS